MKKILFILILPFACTAQSLPLKVSAFMAQQQANGYTPRGIDWQIILHVVLQTSFNVIDLGVPCNDLTANMANAYPMIGTTLSSQSVNLTTPSSDAITWTGSPIPNDGSVTLNGSTTYGFVNILGSSLPTGTSAMSIAIFFKFASNTTSEIIGLGANSGTGKRFAMFYQSNQLFADCGSESAAINWTFDNNWHMMVITKPANGVPSNLVVYLDGSLSSIASTSGTVTINVPSSSSELAIGRVPTFSSSLYFPGTVKFPTIWGRQISTAEQNQFWLSHKYLVGL